MVLMYHVYCLFNPYGLKFFYTLYKDSARTLQVTQWVSITQSNQLMLFREIIAIYCENHTKHKCTVCAECRGFVNLFKAGGTYSDHWALKG
jgi:hypothetical protein